MRQDRFQPHGPVEGREPRFELSRVLPVSVLIGALSAAFSCGVFYATQGSTNTWLTERITRLEANDAASLARLEAAMIERITRLEAATTSRFDQVDRRGDGRVRDMNARIDNTDKRDEALADALSKQDLRLTRMEALKEFMNQNGPGAKRP